MKSSGESPRLYSRSGGTRVDPRATFHHYVPQFYLKGFYDPVLAARKPPQHCLRFKRHLAMTPARLEARMDSLLSFPVGLFHSLQHAGFDPGARPLDVEKAVPAGSSPLAVVKMRSRLNIRRYI